jgi:hypothetical protein
MNAIPILKLYNGAKVACLAYDQTRGAMFVGTTDGRIIRVDAIASTGYLTGDRSVYAQAVDGFGNLSAINWSNIFYGLRNKILAVSEAKTPLIWRTIARPFSAEPTDRVIGTFTSPVMWAGKDLGWWKTLYWTQQIAPDTSAKVGVRVAETADKVLGADWRFVEADATDLSATRSLDPFNMKGQYMQVSVIMSSEARSVSPAVTSLVVSYETKFAVYFFTTKFKLEKSSNLTSALMTGHVSAPKATEVKYGLTNSNSADWNDYTEIELDRLAKMPDGFGDKFKVGVKLVSYSDADYPVVDEFAVSVESQKKNLINKDEY